MPFDGLQISARGAAWSAPDTTTGGGVRQRLRAFRLWLLFGGPSSGIEALDPSDGSEAADPGVVQLLMSAAALIEPENKWIQGAYRTFGGRYCAVGALQAAGLAYGPATRIRARRLLTGVAMQRGFRTVERMNDTCSHAAVLSAFNAAISAALAEHVEVRAGAA